MSTPTGHQLFAQALMRQYGRTVKLIRNAVNTYGVETQNNGNEDNTFIIIGTFRNKTYPFPQNEIDSLRAADEERAPHRERLFKFAVIDLEFVPTIDDRLIDGETHYAVLKADPQFSGEVAITYELVLKPI